MKTLLLFFSAWTMFILTAQGPATRPPASDAVHQKLALLLLPRDVKDLHSGEGSWYSSCVGVFRERAQ
jgi:hypothetical protein